MVLKVFVQVAKSQKHFWQMATSPERWLEKVAGAWCEHHRTKTSVILRLAPNPLFRALYNFKIITLYN